eukprot:235746_1
MGQPSSSLTVDTTISYTDDYEVPKYGLSYKIDDDGWSEYVRMFAALEWTGPIPSSFGEINPRDELFHLVFKIKTTTHDTPSQLRTQADLIGKPQIYKPHQSYINTHLNIANVTDETSSKPMNVANDDELPAKTKCSLFSCLCA